MYRQVDWAAESSSLGSSIPGLSAWKNDGRAALHSGIPQKALRFYLSRIASCSPSEQQTEILRYESKSIWTALQKRLAASSTVGTVIYWQGFLLQTLRI